MVAQFRRGSETHTANVAGQVQVVHKLPKAIQNGYELETCTTGVNQSHARSAHERDRLTELLAMDFVTLAICLLAGTCDRSGVGSGMKARGMA